jgi:hypothetical protein
MAQIVYITLDRADSDRVQQMLLKDGARWSGDGMVDEDLKAIFRTGNSLEYICRCSDADPYQYIHEGDTVIVSKSRIKVAMAAIKQLKGG